MSDETGHFSHPSPLLLRPYYPLLHPVPISVPHDLWLQATCVGVFMPNHCPAEDTAGSWSTFCPVRRKEELWPETGPFDSMRPHVPVGARPWPVCLCGCLCVCARVSGYACAYVKPLGIRCVGGAWGREGKGLHCHSGIRFNFIFLHIFCQVRHVL